MTHWRNNLAEQYEHSILRSAKRNEETGANTGSPKDELLHGETHNEDRQRTTHEVYQARQHDNKGPVRQNERDGWSKRVGGGEGCRVSVVAMELDWGPPTRPRPAMRWRDTRRGGLGKCMT